MSKITLPLFVIILLSTLSYAQNNVGIGTLTPNPNAVLEIQSADKGLLIPRLTTAQRNIFGVGLTNTENSMLVYDVNDSVFYYWKSTVWIPIPGVATDNQNIDSVRLNPLDSVLTVYIEDGLSASVDLKTAFDNTDEQTLTILGDSLEISNGNRVLFIDNDTTNEKIDSVTYTNDTLKLYEGDFVYTAEIILNDNQNIDSVRLNPLDSVLTVYIEDGLSASVDLKTAFDNTDEQTLTILGDSLEISNGNRVLFIDNDTTNEKIDSVTYLNDTLTVYEGDSVYKTEIIGGEWADADRIGESGYIYAKQALNNGTADTVVITDVGYLGVGISNPENKFQVDGNARVGRVREVGAVEPPGPGNVLYFSGGPDVSTLFDTDNSDWIGMGRFNLATDVSELRVRVGDNQGVANNDAFVLGSASIGVHPWNEYFRVQSNGYVHIGTSALPAYPTNQLHLQGEINPLRVEGIQPGTSTDSILTIDATGVIRKIPNSPNGEWNDADSIGMNGFIYAKQALNNGAADTVVVTDGGDMGIGTSNPLEKLDVHTGRINFYNGGSLNYNIGMDNTAPVGISISNTNTNEVKLKLSPVGGTGNSARLLIDNNHTNDAIPMYSFLNDENTGFSGGNGDNNYLKFITDGNEIMRVDSNVGIGTTVPNGKLSVYGQTTVAGTSMIPLNEPHIIFNDALGGGDQSYITGFGGGLLLGGNPANYFSSVTGIIEPRVDLYITDVGRVGIGILNPTHQLHVVSNTNPLRLEGVQQGATTDSVLSINNTGVVRKVEQVFLPPGMISPFATAAAPAGWLVADGSAVSRTTYANLFAAIGTMYGTGDGSTTFNLPDYRGQFLRGVSGASGNDPNAGVRTNRGDGTTGNNVGTKQQDDLASHNHQLKTSTGTAGVDITIADSPLNDGVGWEQTAANPTPYTGAPDAITYNRGGSETRPKNVYVTYCIKY